MSSIQKKKTSTSADEVAEGDTTSHTAARRVISADISSASTPKGGQLKPPPEKLSKGGSDELTAKNQ